MAVRVGINGLGRTGRAAFRAAHERGLDIEWVGLERPDGPRHARPLVAARHGVRAVPGKRRACRATRSWSTASRSLCSRRRIPPRCRGVRSAPKSSSSRPACSEACRRAEAHRGGRTQGDRLRACEGARRHGGARRQLRHGIRRGTAPGDLQRLVHDQLSRACREGAARCDRHPPRRDDDRARIHERPASRRRAAQGSAPRPRGGSEPRADVDRGGEGDRPRDPRAGGKAPGLRRARAHSDRVAHRPHGGDGARDECRRGQRALPCTRRRRRARRDPSLQRRAARLVATSSSRPTRRSSTRR